ncbi:MAG: cbb3-type cytochrome oxidase assembly protein CcoS [Gammaproteobacteria bacterium]|nr:cbb3-type cytochrome oxidase assembly protein CcoS [Gammaproteobacteria bacterium]
MSILLVLIPLSLLLLGLGIAAFFWAVRNDQFEDMDSPAWKILLDDDSRPHPELPEGLGNKSGSPGEKRIGEEK